MSDPQPIAALVETLERLAKESKAEGSAVLTYYWTSDREACSPDAILRLCQAWREAQEWIGVKEHYDAWQRITAELGRKLDEAEARADALQRELDRAMTYVWHSPHCTEKRLSDCRHVFDIQLGAPMDDYKEAMREAREACHCGLSDLQRDVDALRKETGR